MKSFTTKITTFTKHFAAVICLALIAFGCEKELVLPENTAAELQFGGQGHIQRPETQCGASTFSTLSNGTDILGDVEILNNTDKLYLVFDMNLYKFIDELRVFVGDANQIPLGVGGDLATELFPIQPVLAEPANEYSLMIPTSNLATCNQIVVWARVKTLNIWGQTVGTTDTWMSGSVVGNGFATAYCLGSCISGNTANMTVE